MEFNKFLEDIRRECQAFEKAIECGLIEEPNDDKDDSVMNSILKHLVRHSNIFSDLEEIEAHIIELVFQNDKEEEQIKINNLERFKQKAQEKGLDIYQEFVISKELICEEKEVIQNDNNINRKHLLNAKMRINTFLDSSSLNFGRPSLCFRKNRETDSEDDAKAQKAIDEVLEELSGKK